MENFNVGDVVIVTKHEPVDVFVDHFSEIGIVAKINKDKMGDIWITVESNEWVCAFQDSDLKVIGRTMSGVKILQELEQEDYELYIRTQHSHLSEKQWEWLIQVFTEKTKKQNNL